MASFRIVIPTRDSVRWVGVFLSAYRELGVEPFYVVDSRSVDGTLELLRSMGAALTVFTPSGDYVEAGMIEFGSTRCGTDWVFRIDDDEFPTKALLRWAREGTLSPNQAWFISRRDFFRSGDSVFYSRSPAKFHNAFVPGYLNPHCRLFHSGRVRYSQRVHTSGIDLLRSVDFAPEDAFFAHFNCLLRSAEERLGKVRKYEGVQAFSSWRLCDEYLPELFDLEKHHDAQCDGVAEFQPLFSVLPLAPDNEPAQLSDSERLLMFQETAKLGEINLARRSAGPAPYDSANHLQAIAKMPPFLQRRVAEALLTFGRGPWRQVGLQIWNYVNFMQQFPPRPTAEALVRRRF
jgi:hypothetical protein